jgi:hypothetical protein
MVYYGKGFSWSELYDMPVWLRKFYYKKLEEALEKQKKAADEKAPKKQLAKPKIAPKR